MIDPRMVDDESTGRYTFRADGRVTDCNEVFAAIFGFSSKTEAVGTNIIELHPSREAAEHFLAMLRRNRKLLHYETDMRRVDGRRLCVIKNVAAAFDETGELHEVTGYLIDNTEQRLLEERLRHSQKMETVGRLAGGIAHDFNNLLLAIQGYAALLHEHVADRPEGLEALGEIEAAAHRAEVLTRRLLAFGRRQVLQPRVLHFRDVIQDLRPLLQRMLGERVELVVDLADDLGAVRADRAQLEQVLEHLTANARDAMPDGGLLTIAARNVELRETYLAFHDGPPPGKYLEITVADTGVGMSDEVKAHLFEPFFTTKSQGEGVGLGLSSVYGVIKQSGGEIQVHSTVGEGTTFRMLLPRAEQDLKPTVMRLAEEAPGAEETILLVEDEPAVRSLIRQILVRQGYRVLPTNSGVEALALAEQFGGRIDLLLTDLVLPQMNGRELRERLRASHPGIRALYISGYTEDTVVRHGVWREKTHFLQKPFAPVVLLNKIRDVMAEDPPDFEGIPD